MLTPATVALACKNALGVANATPPPSLGPTPPSTVELQQIMHIIELSLTSTISPDHESSATMPTATATQPLQVLAQRISQHETELAQLRKEYETRQKQLTALARRKEQLQEQLEQVEAEIANVDHASAASTPSAKPKPMSVSTPRAKPATGAHASNGASPTTDKAVSERISLPKLLINLVQRASKPVS